MLKYVLGVFLSFVLLVFAFFYLTADEPSPEFVCLSNREMWKHFRWTNEEYGFTPFCTGGNMPDGAVKTVDASMRGDVKVSTDAARKILLHCIHDLLTRINANKELRPYLLNYPFTAVNVCYSIAFDDLRENSVPPPLVSHIQTFRKIIVYSMRDNQTRRRTEVFRESYEDAVRNVSEKNMNNPTHAKPKP